MTPPGTVLAVTTLPGSRTCLYFPRRSYALTTLPWFQLTLLFLAVIKTLPMEVRGNRLPDVYWNSSNPIFRIDNTDHIIDVNQGSLPFEYDQVNIICPVYSRETDERDAETYIIYNVNKEEYDSCRITEPNPRRIAICNKPYKLMYFTITFRSFTPQPGGLEFKPGQDYYFISTSSKDDLYRTIGGRCTQHHMKVVFKVCCDPASKPAHDQAGQHVENDSKGRDDEEEKEMKNKKLALNGSSISLSKPSLLLYVLTALVLYPWR